MTKTTLFRHTLWVSALALLGFGAPTQAAVFCVNSAKTLQTALTTAASNNADDEIRIVQGTYVGNFVYASTQANKLSVLGGYTKSCASRTLNPANTVLDGNQLNSVLVLSAPDAAAEFLVEGLTLRNGKRTSGGGGGLYALVGETGAVTVRRNRIEKNTASSSGGGAYVYGSYGGTITLTNNSFSGNNGGGARVYGATVTLTNNSFSGNSSQYSSGGGAYVYGSYGGTITLTNNSIVGNQAQTGGGLSLSLGNDEMTDSAALYNNLFWDNVATEKKGADLSIYNDSDGDYLLNPVKLFGNNFKYSAAGFQIDIPIKIDSSNRNGLNPLFVDAEKGDFSLLPSSPMIDAGYAQTPNLPKTDLGGGPRVLGGRVDIGAYEFNDGSTDAPDFRVTKLVVTPSKPSAKQTFSAIVTVTNAGSLAGVPGTLQVWANQKTERACNATGNKSAVISTALTPGQSTEVTVSGLPAGVAGAKTLRAFIDSRCATDESNEANNQLTKAYTVAAPAPDFIVTQIVLDPASPKVNGTFSVKVTVKNQGGISADGGWLDVWADAPKAQTCWIGGNAYVSVGHVAAGKSKTLTITGLIARKAGTNTFRAFVDSYCQADESNEGNNQTVKTYTVAP